MVKFIGSRKNLTEDKLEELEELVMDSTKVQAIYEAAKMSMGMDISGIDLINIELFATRVIALVEYRKQLSEYLSDKMAGVAPNLTTLIGEQARRGRGVVLWAVLACFIVFHSPCLSRLVPGLFLTRGASLTLPSTLRALSRFWELRRHSSGELGFEELGLSKVMTFC